MPDPEPQHSKMVKRTVRRGNLTNLTPRPSPRLSLRLTRSRAKILEATTKGRASLPGDRSLPLPDPGGSPNPVCRRSFAEHVSSFTPLEASVLEARIAVLSTSRCPRTSCSWFVQQVRTAARELTDARRAHPVMSVRTFHDRVGYLWSRGVASLETSVTGFI